MARFHPSTRLSRSGDRLSSGYDAAADAYRSTNPDPYGAAVERERQLGVRFSDPYDANAILARRYGEPLPPLQRVASRTSIFPSSVVGGQRIDDQGAVGRSAPGAMLDVTWEARLQAGAMSSGSRDAGLDPHWDLGRNQNRYSGRLTAAGQSMTQRVDRERPYFTVRASGSADVRVTAGMSGGFEQSRHFHVGGGFQGQFMLAEYDTVKLEFIATGAAATEVQFAWLRQGIEAGDVTLHLPDRIVAAQLNVLQFVPEGAYEVSVRAADLNWSWQSSAFGAFIINNTAGGYQGLVGQDGVGGIAATNPVLGAAFTPTVINDIVWHLRPV